MCEPHAWVRAYFVPWFRTALPDFAEPNPPPPFFLISPVAQLCLLYQAKALALRGDAYGAEEAYLHCLEVDPNYLSGLKHYAEFLASRGNEADAAAFHERMRRIKVNAIHAEVRLSSRMLRKGKQDAE